MAPENSIQPDWRPRIVEALDEFEDGMRTSVLNLFGSPDGSSAVFEPSHEGDAAITGTCHVTPSGLRVSTAIDRLPLLRPTQ